ATLLHEDGVASASQFLCKSLCLFARACIRNMYFIITTSRASEIFYQAVTAVPVVTQRKYSNASAVKLYFAAACYSLNSYIATSRTPALHKGAGILVVVGGVTSLDSCPYPHLVKQQILAESTIGSLHNMSGQRLVLGLSATHEFCKVPRACHDSMFNTTYNGISMVPDEAYQYDHIYVHNPWAQYFSIKPDGLVLGFEVLDKSINGLRF
ncbi:unnamed protein product, partial [Fusarium graminearum]